ncbi:MAG: NAD(P)H-dependent oxidoreductase [Bacteroidota bacterium]
MNKVIIVGSARKDGNTAAIVNEMKLLLGCEVIDLNDYNIGYYDYESANRTDDYLPLMERIIKNYDLLILATPVYWYAMSGIMKVFFDRLTDLVTIEKALGRKLKGKKMAVVSCSAGGNLGEFFWLPFKESAKYLDMEYVCDVHTVVGEDNTARISAFVKAIDSATR